MIYFPWFDYIHSIPFVKYLPLISFCIYNKDIKKWIGEKW